jgi:phosphoglycerate dehydrogenase-like enzyme
MKPIVLITPEAMREVEAPYVDLCREAGFEVRYPKNPHLARGLCGEQEAVAELQGVSAVLAGGDIYSESILSALPDLKVIARVGVGYDRVDIGAATARGIPVTITPTSNHEAVAELALALLFAVTKSIVANDKLVRSGKWPRMLLTPLRGRTFGVFGLGRIGRSTAVRAAALGMDVLATEIHPDEDFAREHGVRLVDFDTLLAASDYLSIHCPLTEETRGLFDAQVFAKMKPGSVLINTSRGKLVVESDLHEALQSGRLSGAGLDVYEQEPPSPDNPLFRLDNVVASPHLAGTDESSLVGMGVEAASCVVKLSRGEWPDGAVVNDELRDGWKWS